MCAEKPYIHCQKSYRKAIQEISLLYHHSVKSKCHRTYNFKDTNFNIFENFLTSLKLGQSDEFEILVAHMAV